MGTTRLFLVAGAINAFLAVGLGAIGKHTVRNQFDAYAFELFQTAGYYQMSHALGLILIGTLLQSSPTSPALRWAGWLMLIGVVLFSGSLYLLAVSSFTPLGWLTPIGGTTLLAAWIVLAWGSLKREHSP
ncbi:MAG: DUF423 domain-containing protein [Magnetococcales bacterium]|nr:DUF423 domain-containing protein [Magnetococcales bacterium]